MKNDRFPFLWPETIFTHENTAGQQLDHILSEVDEITDLGPQLEYALEGLEESERLRRAIDLEMMDLHHSIETRIRILIREKGEEYVRMLRKQVQKKNRIRGYYDK